MNGVFSGLDNHYSNSTYLFKFPLSFSSPCTVIMPVISAFDTAFIGLCLEGFFYGKISGVLCSLTCTLASLSAKEVQLYSGLGLYSGIFALYLRCSSNKSTGRTAYVVFFVLCLLHILSTATIICDLVTVILEVSNNSICQNIFFYQLCSRLLVHYRFNLKLTQLSCYFAL